MIRQAVEKAQQFIARHQSYLAQRMYDYWIFFNNDGIPYIGIEEEKFLGYETEVNKNIWLFQVDENYNLRHINKEQEAQIRYSSHLGTLNYCKLNLIFAEEGNKGLGTQLMMPLIIDYDKNDSDHIFANYLPFNHGVKNEDRVKGFYKKFNFNVNKDTKSNSKIYSKFNKKDAENAKLKLINYPTEKTNFKVIIPQKFLENSYIKDDELSK